MSALVMLPGLLLDRRLFAPQIAALGQAVEVSAPELWHFDQIGAAAAAVLEQAPATFALAGLSLGGYVAFEIMRQAPQRVTRLALLNTRAGPDDDQTRAGRERQMSEAAGGEFEKVIEELHPHWLLPERVADHGLREQLREMARAVGPDGFAREQKIIMSRPDSRAGLPAIRCPTLVLCGRQDQVTPPERHDEVAALIPDATLVVVPHCGHLSPIEQPDAVTAQLKAWLRL